MSQVRIVNKHGQGITVDVIGAETTSDAAAAIADHMRPDSYFTGEHHPHNDAVRRLLEDAADAAGRAHEEARERLWAFTRDTAGD